MKKGIVTIGPSLFQNTILKCIDSENYIYRINGAHANARDADDYIAVIRKHLPEADIMLDLPGNKVRTDNLEVSIPLKQGDIPQSLHCGDLLNLITLSSRQIKALFVKLPCLFISHQPAGSPTQIEKGVDLPPAVLLRSRFCQALLVPYLGFARRSGVAGDITQS